MSRQPLTPIVISPEELQARDQQRIRLLDWIATHYEEPITTLDNDILTLRERRLKSTGAMSYGIYVKSMPDFGECWYNDRSIRDQKAEYQMSR